MSFLSLGLFRIKCVKDLICSEAQGFGLHKMPQVGKRRKAWQGKYLYSISAPGFVLGQTSGHSWLMSCNLGKNIFVEISSALQEDRVCFYLFSEVKLMGWNCSLAVLYVKTAISYPCACMWAFQA